MRVKFFNLSAGPNGVIQPGTIVEVTPAEAEILHKGGYAQILEPPQQKSRPETAQNLSTAADFSPERKKPGKGRKK